MPDQARELAALPDDVIRARALDVAHAGRLLLRGASLAVRTGELLAVTGGPGPAVAALLACLSAAVPADGGEVWFNSSPVHRLGARARDRLRGRRFGFLGPMPQFADRLTVAENVAVGALLRGWTRRDSDVEAATWLARVELAHEGGLCPAALPEEARRRAALARAMAGGPTVVFANEPTSGLYGTARDRFLRLLSTAVRSHATTLLLASSEPVVAAVADRCVALTGGRVVPAPHAASGGVADPAGSRPRYPAQPTDASLHPRAGAAPRADPGQPSDHRAGRGDSRGPGPTGPADGAATGAVSAGGIRRLPGQGADAETGPRDTPSRPRAGHEGRRTLDDLPVQPTPAGDATTDDARPVAGAGTFRRAAGHRPPRGRVPDSAASPPPMPAADHGATAEEESR